MDISRLYHKYGKLSRVSNLLSFQISPCNDFCLLFQIRAFENYLGPSRLEYDPNRTLHRDAKNPEKPDPPRISNAPVGNEPEKVPRYVIV
jgi:hypothetical protein